MITLLTLSLPFMVGLLILFFRDEKIIRPLALITSFITLFLTVPLLLSGDHNININWINNLGIDFSLGLDGISKVMVLLTNLLFPFIILAGFNKNQNRVSLLNFLILFTQSALIGVFMATNAFLFYIFWELALIPVYFILLLWGGKGRKKITLRFFIYTLTGSLFLLVGIIYLYQLTPNHTTDMVSFTQLQIPVTTQKWLFWVLFIAFAIKMPVFPFHTWQPPTYTMASTQGVMILAGVMTKMGIYGALRFLFPVVPLGVHFWQDTVISLGIIGVIYASVIAFRQTNLKTLIAYSSMAHLSLMAAAMFAVNFYAFQGMLFQSLSHGITIVMLFYMADIISKRTGSFNIPEMGGLKISAPNMALLFLIIVLASIALPLTAGFVGEFLMITGLYGKSVWFAFLGGLTLILGAIYMLYAYQRVMLGENKVLVKAHDLYPIDYLFLFPLIAVIMVLGIYPQPVFNLLGNSIDSMKNLIDPVISAISTLTN